MKKIFKTFFLLGLAAASTTSCKKYLDVNTNPNDVTSAPPQLILPQALTATAAMSSSFNGPGTGTGMNLAGYVANAGGVGGFGNFWTLVFNNGDATGLWTGTFDNLQDYQYILNNTAATGDYKNYNAIARLMKAFDYLRLVDWYGDVPYTQALQGAAQLQPAYDKGSDVYKACITEIDNAITSMKIAYTATTVDLTLNAGGKIDVSDYSYITGSASNQPMSYSSNTLANGKDMTVWIKFANTIKLRALLRIQKVSALSSFYTTEAATMAALTTNDFISSDVLFNPGYLQQSGKQNPLFNSFAYSYTGAGTQATSYLPGSFATGFYNGNKLTDDGRGKIMYRDYNHSNQLGFQSTSLVASPTGGEWYTGATTGLAASGLGAVKAFDQGEPMMLAAESYFLQAEGNLIGLLPAGMPAATAFNQGVLASFTYLDKDHTEVISTSRNPTAEVAAYQAANPTSYLVNFGLATTTAQKLEAIITQKYIAVNTSNSDEGWSEYRRTLYPVSNPAGDAFHFMGANFATNASPRTDKLAGRILYPASEYSLNTANVPVVNVNSTLVFWDARPTN